MEAILLGTKSGVALVIGLGLGIIGTIVGIAATRKPTQEFEEYEETPAPVEPSPEEEEVVDAKLEEAGVWWAGLTAWQRVQPGWLNEWPLNTDVVFAWTIKNTGNTGAYFQVYMFDPGDWIYLVEGEEITIFEEFHTPAVPLGPGMQFYFIKILGKKLSGEKVGEVWVSDEVQVNYV